MTTVLLGPAPCASCGTPVTVVRRPLVVWCDDQCRACSAQKGTKHRWGMDTAVLVVEVQERHGTPHICSGKNSRSFPMGYAATDGSSVTTSDTIGDGRSSARPSAAAVPCLEV